MSRKRKASPRKKTGSKRKSSRKSPRKSPRKASGRRRGKSSGGRLGRLLRWLLLLTGLVLGLLLPWAIYLNHLVTSEFEGRKWDLPSRVYARPLSLFEGLEISAPALEDELRAAGYRRVASPSEEASYARSGRQFEVFRRSFRFDDGLQQGLRFRLSIDSGRVVNLRAAVGGARLDLVRLDPAEFASIYPLHEEDRTLVSIAAVPELLVTGLQAVEDRQFKQHHGIDPRGLARALLANLRAGRTVQGGSTLTQQLVKNYYLNNERTLPRKANEAIMAVLLEWHYDKAEILEAYLNEVFLGQQGSHAIHGFGRASEFYFGLPVEQLQTHQVALLIGLVKGASLYNPRRHPDRALARRNQVLDIFAETGLLTPAAAERASRQALGVTAEPGTGRSDYAAFVDLVRDQLRRDYREADLRNEGLRIFTTLAPSEQEAAERAVSNGLDELGRSGLPPDLQGALVLADVGSGEIRALVGDRETGRKGFNRALNARRQIGSVIKPLVYLLALEHGSNWLTPIDDSPVTLTEPDGSLWRPENYDRESHGTVNLLEALTRSYNQATVRLGLNIGLNHLLVKLEQLGVRRDIPQVPSTLLGAVELSPLDVAQIYQSLASGGYSVPLRAVTAVQTPGGETLNRYPLRLMPLARRDAVAVLNYGLTEVVRTGTAQELPGLLGSNLRVAGKTGTTNERRDSWFVGYTRDRVAVTWVGLDDNRPAGVTGSNAAMRVWARLFRFLPLEPVSLDMPEGAYWLWVSPEENAVTGEDCPGAVQMPFVAGTEPDTETACLARLEQQERREKKSFWRKWFDQD